MSKNKITLLCQGYLCSPEANTYDIEFIRFKIRDMQSGITLFEISKNQSQNESEDQRRNGNGDISEGNPHVGNGSISHHQLSGLQAVELDATEAAALKEVDGDFDQRHQGRFVRYEFTPQFLKLKTVGAT